MIITTGMAQGINLVLRALARQGVTCVAFEDPGYGSAQADETVRAALAMSIHVTYVPVDEQGLVVTELAASGAQAVVVTPAHQSRTGVVLSPPRRHALTDWARRGGGYVIEDDYDSEFRYDKEPAARCRDWPQTRSSCSARPARHWRPRSASAGSTPLHHWPQRSPPRRK